VEQKMQEREIEEVDLSIQHVFKCGIF